MNSPGFSADLTSFDLLDLVQVIHLDRRDLCLAVRVGQQPLGELRFRQGELLWAEFGETTGETAFLALAAQQYGNLEQLPWTDTGERNVYQPLSRLIMQAVTYRDQHGGPEMQDAWSDEGWGQPPAVFEPVSPLARGAGDGDHPYSGGALVSAAALAELEEVEMPDWMRQVSPSVDEIAAQPTGIMPMTPVLPAPEEPPAAPPSRSLGGPHTPPPLLALSTDERPSAPMGTASLLNGKRRLPGIARGMSRAGAPTQQTPPEDPPTVPLPSVQGGLLEYAPRRDQTAASPVEDQGTRPLLEPEPPPEQTTPGSGGTSILTALASAGSLAPSVAAAGGPPLSAASGGVLAAPAVSGGALPSEGAAAPAREPAPAREVAPSPLAAGPMPATSAAGEARPSSLSLLEQLAYGRARPAQAAEVTAQAAGPAAALPVGLSGSAASAGVNGSAASVGVNESGVPASGGSAPNGAMLAPAGPGSTSAALAVPASAAGDVSLAAPAVAPGDPTFAPSGAASDLAANKAGQGASERSIPRMVAAPSNGKRPSLPKPELAAPGSAATRADVAGGTLAWPLSDEMTQKLQAALESFALQVGPAFLATAMLRADGTVVAQHMANKRVEHDLSSAAYHLAHVMQSSLRALLMGGWGDLDETLITGSTHTVVLRRLGWAEKGLFHMAVLERSGNHGLCRVLMRNSEQVLLQLLASR